MVEPVTIPEWETYSWLRHGFSTREGGVSEVYGGSALNLGWTKEDDPVAVAENRHRLVERIAPVHHALMTLRQVHGVVVHQVGTDSLPFVDAAGRAIQSGDGLVTDQPGMLLGIQTADCVPVMLLDVRQRAVGVLHAGWRGTAAGIVGYGVRAMWEAYGSRIEDLRAAVGPSIGACCYVVGDEVRTAFEAAHRDAASLFDGDRLDLWEANRRQLVASGVQPDKITVVGECTGCAVNGDGSRRYFSHRVERGVTGRMMTLVGVSGAV